MTIFVGYWLYVVHDWLYIAKNGAKSVYITHFLGIYRTRTFIPEETERTGGY